MLDIMAKNPDFGQVYATSSAVKALEPYKTFETMSARELNEKASDMAEAVGALYEFMAEQARANGVSVAPMAEDGEQTATPAVRLTNGSAGIDPETRLQ